MKNRDKKRPTRAQKIAAAAEAKKQAAATDKKAEAKKYDLRKLGLLPDQFETVQPAKLVSKIMQLIAEELDDGEAPDKPVLASPEDLALDLLTALCALMLTFRESAVKMTGQDIPIGERLVMAAELQSLACAAIRCGLGDPLR